jgi:hypothetical protein
MRLSKLLIAGAFLLATCLIVGPGALAADVTHGIAFTKGCSSPTVVGQPYSCSYTVQNIVDDAHDTLTISGITDTVHAASGDVVNSNVLDNAPVSPHGGASCSPSPNRVCTIPFGDSVTIGPFSFYTVQPGDFSLAGHALRDSASLTWHDVCDDPAGTGDTNCFPNPPSAGAASQTIVRQPPDANIQITPATATDPVGDNHVLTLHVNTNDGTGAGFVNAADGTLITASLSNAGGASATFVGPSFCTTSGGTGSCTVTISSPTAGTTTVHGTTTVTVAGVPLTRATGDANAGDSPDAQKLWQSNPQGIIAPTQTTCQDFTGGTAAILGQVNYPSSKGGLIGQGIDPGVFFYYTKITTTTANQVVTVTQSNNSTNNAALFGILNGQAWLYPADCSSHTTGAVSGVNDSGASFTVATPGTYIIGVKYQTKSIAGTPVPVPASITYTFTTSLGGSTSASVALKPK